MIETRQHRRLQLSAYALAFALCYVVLIGGTSRGELDPAIRALNAIVGAALIVTYALHAPRAADRIDRGLLVAVILMIFAAVVSAFPRQSVDVSLSALAYAAAVFVARGVFVSAPSRSTLLVAMMGLSLITTALTALRWLPLVTEWWALNDWQVTPPLDLLLNATPWGHRHDLALMTVMLYPSWWVGSPGRLRATIAVLLGIAVGLIVIVDGSRTLWLALAVASGVHLAPAALRLLRRSRRRMLIAALAIAFVPLLAVVSGITGTLADRLFNLSNLSARLAMWGPLTELWLERPVNGWGPGSFPWLLQMTEYFDLQTWAPRHPDSALLQLLPEAGLMGVASATAVVAVLLPAVLRSPSGAARWALVAFAAAGVGASPTDFAFLIAVAIAWVAYALPREATAAKAVPHRPSAVRWSQGLAGGVIATAYTATLVASLSYSSAIAAVESRRVDNAVGHLSMAIALDPGMALYHRQRGTAFLLEGNDDAAVSDLQAAVALNPSDDLAWRTLGLALSDAGMAEAAETALARAVDVQRSDPTNLLLTASWKLDVGDEQAAAAILAEVLQAWPELAATAAWQSMLQPSNLSSADLIDAAASRSERGHPAPSGNGALLAALAGKEDEWIPGAAPSAKFVRAMAASYRCGDEAQQYVSAASDSERRNVAYWEMRLRVSNAARETDQRATRVFEIMSSGQFDPSPTERTLNPLRENNVLGFSADSWGYRRPPIHWPAYRHQLPSITAGQARWRADPVGAAQATGGRVAVGCSMKLGSQP